MSLFYTWKNVWRICIILWWLSAFLVIICKDIKQLCLERNIFKYAGPKKLENPKEACMCDLRKRETLLTFNKA